MYMYMIGEDQRGSSSGTNRVSGPEYIHLLNESSKFCHLIYIRYTLNIFTVSTKTETYIRKKKYDTGFSLYCVQKIIFKRLFK